MNKLAVFALSAALAATAAAPKKEKVMEWKGTSSPVLEPGTRIANTAQQWAALWKEIGRPAPAADFTKYFGVAVFLGQRNSGGYGVVFENPVENKTDLTIRYRVQTPGDKMVMQMLTEPYAVRLYAKTEKLVSVEALRD